MMQQPGYRLEAAQAGGLFPLGQALRRADVWGALRAKAASGSSLHQGSDRLAYLTTNGDTDRALIRSHPTQKQAGKTQVCTQMAAE